MSSGAGKPSPNRPLCIRWVRPAWLTIVQAQVYTGLPRYVLEGLIKGRLLRTRRHTIKGRLIMRDSIDMILLESVLSGQPVIWKMERKKKETGGMNLLSTHENYVD